MKTFEPLTKMEALVKGCIHFAKKKLIPHEPVARLIRGQQKTHKIFYPAFCFQVNFPI